MTPTNITIIALSSLSLITSATTLAVMLVGAKKMEQQVEEVKTKTNRTVAKLKSALEDLEI